MATLKKKFIGANQVDGSKIKLDNNQALRARNAANSADIDLLKANASDELQLGADLNAGSNDITNVGLVDGRDISADGSSLDSHVANTSNPHSVTKTQVGLSNVDNVQQLPMSYLDTDNTLAADSDTKVPSQKAIKSYVDSATGGLGEFSDSSFRVKDNGDATKKIAFEASGISTATTRTITMPDANVNLGALTNSNIDAAAAITESKLALDYSTSSLNTAIGTKVSKSGDTMSGNLAMGGNKVTGLGAPTANGDALRYDQLGANNGIATLDGSGKVPVSQLPNAVMTYEGLWNASTNSPSLSDGTGNAGMVYRVSVAGSQDLGSGSISFEVGDYAIYNASGTWEKADTTDAVASVNGQTGIVSLDSDDISEGATNLYFSDERAQDAVGAMVQNSSKVSLTYVDGTPSLTADIVAGSLVNADINAAAAIAYSKLDLSNSIVAGDITANAVTNAKIANDAVDENKIVSTSISTTGALNGGSGIKLSARVDSSTMKINGSNNLEGLKDTVQRIVLSGTDITNQYVDLSFAAYGTSASVNSVRLSVVGGLEQDKTVDYTVSLTGGSGGVTRISFAGDLATGGAAELVATDILMISYSYLT